LKRRNYDLLMADTMIPRILVVMDLPKNEADWMEVTSEGLMLRRCAYWTSLGGLGETTNKESVTILIQRSNRFDVKSLQALMEQARRGTIA